MSQGLVCSTMKAARELGSERRETVWSISGGGVRVMKGSLFSTRGQKETYLLCFSYYTKSKCWQATCGLITVESI